MAIVPNVVLYRGRRLPAGPLNPLATEVVEGWIKEGMERLPVPEGHFLVARTIDADTGEPVLRQCDTREEAAELLREQAEYELVGANFESVRWFAMLPREAVVIRATNRKGAA